MIIFSCNHVKGYYEGKGKRLCAKCEKKIILKFEKDLGTWVGDRCENCEKKINWNKDKKAFQTGLSKKFTHHSKTASFCTRKCYKELRVSCKEVKK